MSTTASTWALPGPPNLARSLQSRRGGAIPGLHYRQVGPADPEKVTEVDRRLEEWARRLDLFPPAWSGTSRVSSSGGPWCSSIRPAPTWTG